MGAELTAWLLKVEGLPQRVAEGIRDWKQEIPRATAG